MLVLKVCPELPPNKEESNWNQSPGYDSVGEFLDSILYSESNQVTHLQTDTVNNIPTQTVLDNPATTPIAQMDYQGCDTTDSFLENLEKGMGLIHHQALLAVAQRTTHLQSQVWSPAFLPPFLPGTVYPS